MVERASSSIYSSESGQSVSRGIEIPWSTVPINLHYILKWYPYKSRVMQTLKPQDKKTRLEFPCQYLAKVKVDDTWPWKILWLDEAQFYLVEAGNIQNCRI
ncbi:uncharacterized protein TNCV_340251 [Trichonephila clavipes]|nr:uncharacterized protein TNCV_340251 [Trichonephila clavipes]